MTIILIDERERERGALLKAALDPMGHQVIKKTLEVGDVTVGNSVGIEYKTPKDFADSIVDGRLFDQSRRLAQEYRMPFIVVDGTMQDCVDQSSLKMESILGATTSLMYREGIPVLFLSGSTFIDFILSMLNKVENASRRGFVPVVKKNEVPHAQIRFMCNLPGLSSKNGKKLLELYQTPLNALNSVEDWDHLPNIGPKRLKRIKEVILGEYDPDRTV